MRIFSGVALAIALASASQANAAEFKISFDWKGLALCFTGSPNLVDNPEFAVSGLPAGTQFVQFKMTDKNVPNFDHGGGVVAMTANGKVPKGAFKYLSPCPPGSKHKYEWTATAKDKKGWGAKTLGVAKASRMYPE